VPSPGAQLGVEAHRGAVDGLLERVNGEQSQRRAKRRAGGALPALLGEQPREGFERQLPQPLPLGHEPVLEQRAAEGEALQEVAPVEIHGVGQ
jgi:hypothetical protein